MKETFRRKHEGGCIIRSQIQSQNLNSRLVPQRVRSLAKEELNEPKKHHTWERKRTMATLSFNFNDSQMEID
jgi:hypothetical protein